MVIISGVPIFRIFTVILPYAHALSRDMGFRRFDGVRIVCVSYLTFAAVCLTEYSSQWFGAERLFLSRTAYH